MKHYSRFYFSILSTAFVIFSQAQTLTLEQIYNKGLLRSKGIGAIKWLPGGDEYLTLERNDAAGGRDVVRYSAETGDREVLIPAEKFIPEGEKKPLSVSSYSWSEDNTKLLIFTNTKRVWYL